MNSFFQTFNSSIFVNSFKHPSNVKQKHFASAQEAVRKDIECAFGILVQRFHVLQRPLRMWYLEDITDLLDCCIILHNMTVDARAGKLSDEEEEQAMQQTFPLFGHPPVDAEDTARDGADLFASGIALFNNRMQSETEHHKLKNDLVEHTSSAN